MTNDKDSTVPLIIQDPKTSRELFRIKADGSVVGEIVDASEAAKVFFEALRSYLPQPTQSDALKAENEQLRRDHAAAVKEANIAKARLKGVTKQWHADRAALQEKNK
ncbi:hypothetical protein UFOVP714_12 [uncultured Caudovirales phage]|uniref:Uncharacterized protein n=1 Tax=uncultured Caudovirales phage TaxID=2100421 RepID=A0A6J5PCX6_9CAUD|nr:hypothetical protein UFOVP714_12 [uncultured Caudovirales phage]CAB4167756.1 hypothetical protein UFOVP864_48 [uncultured Caudovirales phage]